MYTSARRKLVIKQNAYKTFGDRKQKGADYQFRFTLFV